MAGIYIHIPFCKQACHYCNFHFTTSVRRKNELIAAIVQETNLQKEYAGKEWVETVYLGGGTPSLLTETECRWLMDSARSDFAITTDAEITLEANPDDITEAALAAWKEAGINRLSIGVQSFFEEDLQWMNRAHTAQQAEAQLQLARRYFDNITIDLIYGTPTLTDEKWRANVNKALTFGIPHLSCYALTVEPKTPLHKLIIQQKKEDTDPEKQARQFLQLMDWMETAGWEHYEISNFAQPGFRSRHNTSYWQGKTYLGLGPSAHSFNGYSRQWNVANNNLYIQALQQGNIPAELEYLSATQLFNEYVMISLRTCEGLQKDKALQMLSAAGNKKNEFEKTVQQYLQTGKMTEKNGILQLTREGKLLADGIAADLFITKD